MISKNFKSILLVLVLFLSHGCTTKITDVKLKVNKDLSSEILILVEDKPEKSLEIIEKSKKCGFKARKLPSIQANNNRIEILGNFSSPFQIQNGTNCSDFGEYSPYINLTLEEGIFRNKYSAEITYKRPFVLFGNNDVEKLSIIMPGKISKIINLRIKPLHKIYFEMGDGNEYLIHKEPNNVMIDRLHEFTVELEKTDIDIDTKNGQDTLGGIFKKYNNVLEPTFHFKVISYKTNFKIDTFFAIAGILLGSGCFISILNAFRNKLKK